MITMVSSLPFFNDDILEEYQIGNKARLIMSVEACLGQWSCSLEFIPEQFANNDDLVGRPMCELIQY